MRKCTSFREKESICFAVFLNYVPRLVYDILEVGVDAERRKKVPVEQLRQGQLGQQLVPKEPMPAEAVPQELEGNPELPADEGGMRARGVVHDPTKKGITLQGSEHWLFFSLLLFGVADGNVGVVVDRGLDLVLDCRKELPDLSGVSLQGREVFHKLFKQHGHLDSLGRGQWVIG